MHGRQRNLRWIYNYVFTNVYLVIASFIQLVSKLVDSFKDNFYIYRSIPKTVTVLYFFLQNKSTIINIEKRNKCINSKE